MPWDATKPSPNACQKLPNLAIVERFALVVPRPAASRGGQGAPAQLGFVQQKTMIFFIARSFEKKCFVMTLGVRL